MTKNQKILIGIALAVTVVVAIYLGLRYYAKRKHEAQVKAEKDSGIDIESQWLETDIAKRTNLDQSLHLLAAAANHYKALNDKTLELDALIAEYNKRISETETEIVVPKARTVEPQTEPNADAPTVLSVVRDAPIPAAPILPSSEKSEKPLSSLSNDFQAFLDLANNPSAESDNAQNNAEKAVITAEIDVNDVNAARTPNEILGDQEKLEYAAIKNSTNIEDWEAFRDSIEVHNYLKAIAAKKIKSLSISQYNEELIETS